MSEAAGPETDVLEADTLAAVASLWRKTRREVRARFGGSSMEPALAEGAEVVLRCGETGAPGDVIAFLANGRLVLHRVVARAPDEAWTLTRGDARVLPDPPIRTAEAILGRVTGVWRAGSLQPVPVPRDSFARRWTLRLVCAVLRASPGTGAAALRSLHTGSRVARTLPLLLRRSPRP